jgi:hypothetical protein
VGSKDPTGASIDPMMDGGGANLDILFILLHGIDGAADALATNRTGAMGSLGAAASTRAAATEWLAVNKKSATSERPTFA